MNFLKLICLLIIIFSTSLKAEQRTLELTTFNLGLAHNFVPYAKERLPKIIEALTLYDSDILCLQEVWTEEDRNKILLELKNKYPWTIVPNITQKYSKSAPSCQLTTVFKQGAFGRCMVSECMGKKKDEFTSCVVNTCREPLNKLKNEAPECATALMAQVDKTMLHGLFTIFNPFKPAGLFAYGGSNGLMLLSRYPIKKSKLIPMEDISTLNRRDIIYAEVEVKNKPHHLYCTHLTANLTQTAPYTGKFLNWEEENNEQISVLLKDIQELQKTPLYALGDFNCSTPHLAAGIEGDFSQNCQRILDSGLTDPLYNIGPGCSFCKTNAINAQNNEKNLLIDHIFIKEAIPRKVDIAFREKILLKTKDSKKEIETNLSDHYGVGLHIEID